MVHASLFEAAAFCPLVLLFVSPFLWRAVPRDKNCVQILSAIERFPANALQCRHCAGNLRCLRLNGEAVRATLCLTKKMIVSPVRNVQVLYTTYGQPCWAAARHTTRQLIAHIYFGKLHVFALFRATFAFHKVLTQLRLPDLVRITCYTPLRC